MTIEGIIHRDKYRLLYYKHVTKLFKGRPCSSAVPVGTGATPWVLSKTTRSSFYGIAFFYIKFSDQASLSRLEKHETSSKPSACPRAT